MCSFSEMTSFVSELSAQFFGCVCDLVSVETKAVVSGKLSNELCLCRSVIFDWLGGLPRMFSAAAGSPRFIKTAAGQSEIVALKCSCLLT